MARSATFPNVPAKPKGKNKRTRLFQGTACGKQCSATSGAIFNDSHPPALEKAISRIVLVCEAKKGVSAKQLERHLGVNYRTSWYLAHRIREAMKVGFSLLTREDEIDETYIGARVFDQRKPYVEKYKRT